MALEHHQRHIGDREPEVDDPGHGSHRPGLNPLPRPVWPRAGLDAESVQFPVVDVSSWTRGEPEPGGDEAKLWLSAPDAFPLGGR
jgi:hypothetical protein